jgi:murein DD-endopeptidase MepM/ murein hydrolase activator NlpD
VQHRQVRGHRHALAPESADAARVYLELLSSAEPLTPAAPAPADDEAAPRGYLGLHRAARRTVPFAPLGERGRAAVIAAAVVAGVSVAGLSTAAASAHSDTTTTATAPAPAPAAAHSRLDPTSPAPTGSPSPSATAAPAGAARAADAGSAVATTEAAGAGSIAGADAEPEADQVDTGGPALGYAPLRRKAKPLPTVTWVDPMPAGVVTSCFGQRWGRLHAGVDLAAPSGTPIRAVGAGTVVAAGPADGYGIAALIDHGNGYLTHYGHMSALSVVAGQRVRAGEEIGLEGSTGHSTGPHLHFEVHQGSYQNPIEPTAWLHERGVDITGCSTPAEDLTDD